MRLSDARRLRGPSLGADGPGAMVEIALEHGDSAPRVARMLRASVAAWLRRLRRELPGRVGIRSFRAGLAMFVPAPIDALGATLDLAEAAVESVRTSLAGASASRGRDRQTEAALRRAFASERSARLLALQAAARRCGATFLFDDDVVSVGSGRRARIFERDALPDPGRIPWRAVESIPVALVTGTNGKTTTTRWVARMAKRAGLVPGNTSSDGVAIDEVIVEAGDNTGGESARRVLRDPRVEIAILETARGGLLRRGLAVTHVDAALITNVSADHLGEHGVLDLETMVATKAVVARAVRPGGKVVLGADDPRLMALPMARGVERVLFATSARRVRAHLEAGGHAFVREGRALVHRGPEGHGVLAELDEIPLASGGAAPHNVKNALAAAALAWSLGLPGDAIRAGLRDFGASPSDNPGRGQLVTTAGGARVLFDFGHNPAAAADLYAWAVALAASSGHVHAVVTQPGDRDGRAMKAFARAIVAAGVREAVVWERESLLRGRAAGEITRTLVDALRAAGLPPARVRSAADEASAIRAALDHATKNDLVVVSPSLDRALPPSV